MVCEFWWIIESFRSIYLPVRWRTQAVHLSKDRKKHRYHSLVVQYDYLSKDNDGFAWGTEVWIETLGQTLRTYSQKPGYGIQSEDHHRYLHLLCLGPSRKRYFLPAASKGYLSWPLVRLLNQTQNTSGVRPNWIIYGPTRSNLLNRQAKLRNHAAIRFYGLHLQGGCKSDNKLSKVVIIYENYTVLVWRLRERRWGEYHH